MIIKRLIVLQAVLLLGLGAVVIIPKYRGPQPQGVTLTLPSQVGDWYGEAKTVSDREKQALGSETEFGRKLYTSLSGDEVFVSVVLAGQDVTTSLHRPERCLPAQGWTIIDKKIVTLPVNAGSIHAIRATRLLNIGGATDSANVYSIYYYWFVGCDDVLASPFERSMVDWRDRFLKGYSQRWAYITVATIMNGNSSPAQAAADAKIKGLIAQLFPRIWKPQAAKS